jgi:hypothetical protein
VPAQPTQHLGGLNTERLAKRWCLSLWRLLGVRQNVSHLLQIPAVNQQPSAKSDT